MIKKESFQISEQILAEVILDAGVEWMTMSTNEKKGFIGIYKRHYIARQIIKRLDGGTISQEYNKQTIEEAHEEALLVNCMYDSRWL